jgi:hypothetical protein
LKKFLFKDPYVINDHSLRESGSGIRTARPVTTNSYIKYEKEWRIERIWIGAYVGFIYSEKKIVVNK